MDQWAKIQHEALVFDEIKANSVRGTAIMDAESKWVEAIVKLDEDTERYKLVKIRTHK
jgi:hypothetical protein